MTAFPGPHGFALEQLQALSMFLPVFQSPGFLFGQWEQRAGSQPGAMTFPAYKLSLSAEAFVRTAYRAGWVRPDFDWAEWQDSEEARALRGPDGLHEATAEQVARLLTVCIRRHRFVEGGLAADYRSGLLTRILRRLNELAIEAGGGAGGAEDFEFRKW